MNLLMPVFHQTLDDEWHNFQKLVDQTAFVSSFVELKKPVNFAIW